MLPAKQSRSRQNRDNLLRAGKALAEQLAWEEITVSKLAEHAGCSVGAFYQRFSNKDAFLEALIEDLVFDTRQRLDVFYLDPSQEDLSHALFADKLVAFSVSNFRTRAGLLRAALRKGIDQPSTWEPIRLLGHAAASRLVDHLGRQNPLSPANERQVRFAYQMLLGTLVNAIMNRPGPFGLETADFERELQSAFCRLLPVLERE